MEKQFLWGTATSAHQVEGHNDRSDWAEFERAGFVEGGAQSGRASDHWNQVQLDLSLIKNLGLNSYRFSIEWAKIEPEPGQFSKNAMSWYIEMVLSCKKLGIVPMLTLHHFTSPLWFSKNGGFSNKESINYFLNFVDFVLLHLGEHVDLWCTFNEPMVLVIGQYLGQFMPPKIHSPALAAKAIENILKIHVLTYEKIHNYHFKIRNENVSVGYAHNLIRFFPDRAYHPIEFLLSKVYSRFYNKAWVDSTFGLKQKFNIPFLITTFEDVPEAFGKVSTDFIGVNYYTKAYAQWRPRDSAENQMAQLPLGIAFARKNELQSDLGWATYPQGLLQILRKLKHYQKPIYITENGMADRLDQNRTQYIRDHLLVTAKGIEEGIDIRGYYYWSLLDNFEWIKGFGPRFGLYQVNYQNFERRETESARWLSRVIKLHSSRISPKTDLILSEINC